MYLLFNRLLLLKTTFQLKLILFHTMIVVSEYKM